MQTMTARHTQLHLERQEAWLIWMEDQRTLPETFLKEGLGNMGWFIQMKLIGIESEKEQEVTPFRVKSQRSTNPQSIPSPIV